MSSKSFDGPICTAPERSNRPTKAQVVTPPGPTWLRKKSTVEPVGKANAFGVTTRLNFITLHNADNYRGASHKE